MTAISADVASALARQAPTVSRRLERLCRLHRLVDRSNDLSFGQFVQLYALTVDVEPDLVVELGRGYGNATAALTQAATDVERARVVSLGFDSEEAWRTRTWPRLAPEVEPTWSGVLDARQQDLFECELEELFRGSKRILLWWDEHGAEIGQFILGRVLPLVAARDNIVVVHDVTDARYRTADTSYDGQRNVWLGHLVSPFEDIVAVVDFLSRNGIDATTPLDSLSRLRTEDPVAWSQLDDALDGTDAAVALDDGAALLFSLPRDRAIVFPTWETPADAGIASPAHHPAIARLPRWKGESPAGWEVDVIGVRTNELFITGPHGHRSAARTDSPPLPNFDEEYFEWIDLAEAVESAVGGFTMVELGAGYGRWIARGAVLARARGLPVRVVGVEGDPSHFEWMEQHLIVNGVDRTAARLIEAAVYTRSGWVAFDRLASPQSYGQAIDMVAPAFFERRPIGRTLQSAARLRRDGSTSLVRAKTLDEILDSLERIDLIDVDIQGAEADVLEAGIDVLDSKVALVHVGTHSSDVEERLRELFGRLGWKPRYDFGCGTTAITPWGAIAFSDGVQSWQNPRLGGSPGG